LSLFSTAKKVTNLPALQGPLRWQAGNAAAAEKMAKNQFITLKENNSSA